MRSQTKSNCVSALALLGGQDVHPTRFTTIDREIIYESAFSQISSLASDRFCSTPTARDRNQNRFPHLARFLVHLHTLETYRWRWVVGLARHWLVYDLISASIYPVC